MDAHNLTIVLCPNLVSSSNPARDVMMCAVPNSPTPTPTPSLNQAALSEGKGTLGMVIKLCIQRYYEVFDEVWDRSEALPPRLEESRTSTNDGEEEDDDIDDEMLVMPLGPGQAGAWPASARFNYKPRRKSGTGAGTPIVQSMHTIGKEAGDGDVIGHNVTLGRSKSMVSVERGTRRGKGSIAVGRGTTRKSSGAAVEAVGVTAAGFFSPPPIPTPSQQRNGMDMFDGDS